MRQIAISAPGDVGGWFAGTGASLAMPDSGPEALETSATSPQLDFRVWSPNSTHGLLMPARQANLSKAHHKEKLIDD
jgi:hypothetical protein